MDANNLEQKEKIEIEFWRDSEIEHADNFTINNLINKFGDAEVLYNIVSKYDKYFQKAESILELGGGQGWGSCIVKKLFGKYSIASDISPYAIASLKHWEEIFNTKIDTSFACRSYEIPLKNESIDLVFCFAAAHHFVKHEKTLTEIRRVLKSGGTCIYMYEPSCRKYLYRFAYNRVNKKRPEVPEDVLVYNEIKRLGEKLNFTVRIDFYPSYIKRGPVETIYYIILGKIPFLQKYLPCTANYIFELAHV